MFERLKVVFLDAEGTFLRFQPPLGEIYQRIWQNYGITIHPEATERALRSAYREIFQEKLSPPLNGDLCKDAWREVFQLVFGDLKTHPAFDQVFREAFGFFAKPECVEVIPGFDEFLKYLRDRELKCAVISNWDCRLYSVLEGHGLLQHFDAVFLGCEVGYLKPDPRIFERALSHFSVLPEETLMIGDSIKDDIEPAIRLKMNYYHVSTDFDFWKLLKELCNNTLS